jgi:hypothetical protein
MFAISKIDVSDLSGLDGPARERLRIKNLPVPMHFLISLQYGYLFPGYQIISLSYTFLVMVQRTAWCRTYELQEIQSCNALMAGRSV